MGRPVNLYLAWQRRGWRAPAKMLGLLLGCEVNCKLPNRLFMPHPQGVVVDGNCRLGENVVLLQQVTLGVLNWPIIE